MILPSVAAVIPVHNGERYVAKALESVFRQTSMVDEVIVVDDGSTDETPRVLETYARRARILRQPNRGVAAARNAGFRYARTDWLALLDADDSWHSSKIERFRLAILSQADAAFFYSDAWQVDAADRIERALSLPRPGPLTSEDLLLRPVFVTSAVVMNRAKTLDAGLQREDFRAKAGVEDWDFFVRLAQKGPGVRVAGRWTFYRRHASSATRSHRAVLRRDAVRVVLLNRRLVAPGVARRALAAVHYEGGVRDLVGMDLLRARKEFGLAMRWGGRRAGRAAVLWFLTWGGKTVTGILLKTRRWMYGRIARFHQFQEA